MDSAEAKGFMGVVIKQVGTVTVISNSKALSILIFQKKKDDEG